MKIGFDAKRVFHNRTGLGNYSRDLIRILGKYYPGHTYHLYTPKPSRRQLFDAASHGAIEKLPEGKFYSTFYNLWRQHGICSTLKKDGIDVFHGLTAELPINIQNTGIPSVVTIHDLIFIRYPDFYPVIDRWIYTQKARNAALVAHKVVAISEQTRQDLIHFLKIDPDKIQVIYQGCQQVFQQPIERNQRKQLLSRFNLPENYILNVGTIEKRKNLLRLVKAIHHLDTHLVVLGSETPYAKEVKDYIAKHRMDTKVSFLKGLASQELAALYQSAQVFVYPSLFEGFGIPIVEALFSGTPVITTQGGCFGEAGGPGSMYVNSSDVGALHAAIAEVLQNEELRTKMRNIGLDYAQRFTDEKIGKAYMELYASLSKEKP